MTIEIAELGAWGGLLAEYDARARTIRVGASALRARTGAARRRFFVEAIAHELYHHLEASGEISRRGGFVRRENAARAYGRRAIR